MDTVRSAITEPVRRLEVFTGAGRRWKRSDEDKARIVAGDRSEWRLDLCRGSGGMVWRRSNCLAGAVN
jgi:hypothetical protein